MRRSKAGFTLIELLVVIAIIAILASILFPVFSRARGKARQSACSSNMKQIATALIAYASDYDNMTPYWATGPARDGAPVTGQNPWDVTCMPYIKNTQIFVCGDNKFNGQAVTVDGASVSGPKRGYAIARYMAGVDQDTPPDPSRTLVVVEKGAYPVGVNSDAPAEFCQQAGSNQDYPTVAYRHNGGNNFAYIDGHVKWAAGTAGPFANDGAGKVACDTACDAAGALASPTFDHTNVYYGHLHAGHICWPADFPQSDY